MACEVNWRDPAMKDLRGRGKQYMDEILNIVIPEIRQKPNSTRGNTVKPLRKAKSLWRYRFGDNWRLVYAHYPEKNMVQIIAIDHRDRIYERLNLYQDDETLEAYIPALEAALDPNAEAPEDWGNYSREREDKSPLPYILSYNQLKEWGIPEEYHDILSKCRTEEELLDCQVPGLYIDEIIDLMFPDQIEEIVQQPIRTVRSDEDLREYVDGKRNLLDFLLYLDEEQAHLIDWAQGGGPTLVKGAAGSGKSTIALYRARKLCIDAAHSLIPPRILFTTYTNALINSSDQLFQHLIGDEQSYMQVTTVDKLAREIVNSVDGYIQMAKDSMMIEAVRASKFNLKLSGNDREQTILNRQLKSLSDDYILEEIKWVIEGRGIGTLSQYMAEDRTGRGIGLSESLRAVVWQIYLNYQTYLQEQRQISWGMLRKRALDYVRNGKWAGKKYNYILIDEAQDLTPVAISFCLEICESPAGVFLTADAGQSIYNRGFSWRRVHQDLNVTGRTRILKRNYRTTREIATAANSILLNGNAGDDEVLDQFYVHSGPKPLVFKARDDEEMIYWIQKSIRTALQKLRLPVSAVAVLSRTNRQAKSIARKLEGHGLCTEYMEGRNLDLNKECVKSLTIHSAKGLEFPIIVVPYVEEGNLPTAFEGHKEEAEINLALERRLLYVACSRAMRRLFVAYRQGRRSRFLQEYSCWTQDKIK